MLFRLDCSERLLLLLNNYTSTVICQVTVFHPIAVETQGRDLLGDVGRRLLVMSEHCKNFFLFQRVSVVVHRFNSVLLHDSFCVQDQPG